MAFNILPKKYQATRTDVVGVVIILCVFIKRNFFNKDFSLIEVIALALIGGIIVFRIKNMRRDKHDQI
jgi:hypothetical protein